MCHPRNGQEHLLVLGATEALVSRLLPQWFLQTPLCMISKEAAVKAADTFESSLAHLSYSCQKPRVLFLQGALALLCTLGQPPAAAAAGRATAAEALEAAVKLQPSLVSAWNCLGVLHSVAGQLVMAMHCLSAGLQQQVTVEGLRQLSLLLRQLANNTGALPMEKHEAVSASLAAAKQAVSMDVSDGFSWYVLGMAHIAADSLQQQEPRRQSCTADALLASSSTDSSAPDQQSTDNSDPRAAAEPSNLLPAAEPTAADSGHLRSPIGHAKAALSALLAAERCKLKELPELWFNRAAVALHLGDLSMALQDFISAAQMDSSLAATSQINSITQLVVVLSNKLAKRHAGLNQNQTAALWAALLRDVKSGAVRQLLPTGYQPITWQHLQQQRLPKPSKPCTTGRGTSMTSNNSCSNGLNLKAALHCRIAAVMEGLPGCSQWICVAMDSGGTLFAVMLPRSIDIKLLVVSTLVVVEPSIAAVTVLAAPGAAGGSRSGQVTLQYARVEAASQVLSSNSSSKPALTTLGCVADQQYGVLTTTVINE